MLIHLFVASKGGEKKDLPQSSRLKIVAWCLALLNNGHSVGATFSRRA